MPQTEWASGEPNLTILQWRMNGMDSLHRGAYNTPTPVTSMRDWGDVALWWWVTMASSR